MLRLLSHSVSSFISVSGLKCYTCVGTDETCSKDELEKDSSKETTCPPGMDQCTRTWAKRHIANVSAVVNACGNEETCKGLKETCYDDLHGHCHVGCCDTDLCNAGLPVSFSVFLMTVCSALGLALLN